MNQISRHLTVVEPSRGWISLKLKDLWEYRELLYFLTWRDIKVRYKHTALGAAWAADTGSCAAAKPAAALTLNLRNDLREKVWGMNPPNRSIFARTVHRWFIKGMGKGGITMPYRCSLPSQHY